MDYEQVVAPIELEPIELETIDAIEHHAGNNATDKLKTGYVEERSKLEITEVELNRSKIMVVDKNGNLKKISILSEH